MISNSIRFILPLLLLAANTFATTWTFDFNGGRSGLTQVSGTGQFSYDTDLTTVNLSDLHNFQMDYTWQYISPDATPYEFLYTYNKADLTQFALTTVDGQVNTLSASDTTATSLSKEYQWDFTTIAPGNVLFLTTVFSTAQLVLVDPPDAAVPEPTTLMLFVLSSLGLCAARLTPRLFHR